MSSSYFFNIYGVFIDSSTKETGTKIRGDFIHGDDVSFFSFHSTKPDTKYKIFVPCSSKASLDLDLICFKVFCLSKMLPSAFISPILTGMGQDKVSNNDNTE